MTLRSVLVIAGVWLFCLSCQKWKDNPTDGDSRLTTHYCNDPKAVNYNWGFPGIADNTVCYYPSALFSGNYTFIDSVYFSNNILDSASTKSYNLTITALDTVKISVAGLCGNPSSNLVLTATKLFTASVDSTFYNGRQFCNATDTITGTFTKSRFDTTGRFAISLTVLGAGQVIKYHKGTAIKQ